MAHKPFALDYARQARLYRRSRDVWKQRCADKHDTIRSLLAEQITDFLTVEGSQVAAGSV